MAFILEDFKNNAYSIKMKSVIKEEFPTIEDCVYVDHAAATLYSKSQLNSIFSFFRNNLYGNPHSRHGPSDLCTQTVEAVRNRILEHFVTDTKKYSVIFTSGATASIKLVGECFQWGLDTSSNITEHESVNKISSAFVYTNENHTSVLGVREYAANYNAAVIPIPIQKLRYVLEMNTERKYEIAANMPKSLVAYPAQCNYTGAKYPLDWIDSIHDGHINSILEAGEPPHEWYLLLDAAGLVGTSPLNLSKYSPDFVPVSFYKIFGYPTGLGCLLVSKRGQKVLQKKYFGGGTVSMVDAFSPTVHKRAEFHERFEDGSLPFLNVISLDFGFSSINRLSGGLGNIEKHTFNIAKYFFYKLKNLKHSNGTDVAIVYCETEEWTVANQGGIVNFNLLYDNGCYIGYSQVEKMASLYNIHLRTGCVCNPGACQRYLNITTEVLKEQFFAGHVCGDTVDLIENRPTGSVRVSFGYISTFEDADKVIKMITECFMKNDMPNSLLDKEVLTAVNSGISEIDESNYDYQNSNVIVKLTDLLVYPVKSCGPMIVNRWNIGKCGMEYDRYWMVVSQSGITITQKKNPRMALISPKIYIKEQKLVLSSQGYEPCEIPIETMNDNGGEKLYNGRVCGNLVRGVDCGEIVANWIAGVLDCEDVRLLRMIGDRTSRIHKGSNEVPHALSLSNQSQILIINRSSLSLLQYEILSRSSEHDFELEDLILRFRPNLVVEGGVAFSEDKWKKISIGNHNFKVKGSCDRCQIVCVSPRTANRTKEPLLTLSAMRGSSAKFGVHTFHSQIGASSQLSTGVTGVAYN